MVRSKTFCCNIFFGLCLIGVRNIFALGNQYYFGDYQNPFNNENTDIQTNGIDPIAVQRRVAKLSPGFPQHTLFLEGPVRFETPTTDLGKKLSAELASIKYGGEPVFNNDYGYSITNTPETRVEIPGAHLETNTKPRKKAKSKQKSESTEKESSIYSSHSISDRDYFLPVPYKLGKGVELNEGCLFYPTPMKISKKDYFWKKIDEVELDSSIDFTGPVTGTGLQFRTSSECLHLFEDSFVINKRKELLISPERFVSLARQVAMQLRDSLLNFKYVISTEDICLAMRILLFLPHPLRNTANCRSAIIAAIGNSDEIYNYELLDQFDEHMGSKFSDVSFVCKSILKFNEPMTNARKKQVFKPTEIVKLFRLDLMEQNSRVFNRLSIPHRRAALKVQESYKKYMKEALLYDIAASIIFLLNELHEIDQSVEQCSTIVVVCVSMQTGEDSNLRQDIAERICKDLGVQKVSNRHSIKYSPPIILQLLMKQTQSKPGIERGSTSYTLPSGKELLPSSRYGHLSGESKLEIWPSIGKVLLDGTISSHIIPTCTGLHAFELNRFLLLNTMIERYMIISGFEKFKLTVEDICLIAKYYVTYKTLLRNESGDKISQEDAIPLAILKVAQKLALDIFTISSCKEIYREFSEEESAVLKKISGSNKQAKLESYYSKPPFSYNSNIVLMHTPNAMVNGKMNSPSSWTIFMKSHACSHLKPYVLNRMVLFVAFVLEVWRKNMPFEKIPFKSITEMCNGFSGDIENYRPRTEDFKSFSEDWILQKIEGNLHANILDSYWSNFLVYENSAFPKNTEESESNYLQRIYHNILVPEPLFAEDWKNIVPPIRIDIAEFIKLLPLVQKPIDVISTLDSTTLNNIRLIRAFLESFFEETYQFPVVIPEKDVLLLLERRELEKKPLDDLFFEIMSSKGDWKWIKHEVSSHAILQLLEYLKTIKKTVENQIKRIPTKNDMFSSPRAVFVHGKWLIKAPHPVFSPASPLQKRALRGLPKYMLNKARYIQAYFINSFETVFQFELIISLADIIYSLTNSLGDDRKLVEILTERISSQSGQSFITGQVVNEIYTSCISFSFYRYLLKGALSEEQAFAAPRVFYKPKVGWKFLPPNTPDFSRLLVLSNAFNLESESNKSVKDSDQRLYDGGSKKIVIRPYTWQSLKDIEKQQKLEIWQLNRAISMCAYFNHWISYRFPKKNLKDIKVSACINSIYRLKNMKERLSQSDIFDVFLRYIGISFLKEDDVREMLSAFTSFEHIDKPNGMGSRQWLINLYRIPQIQETSQNSLSEEFESLRFPIPPIFGKQNVSLNRDPKLLADKSTEIPKIIIPLNIDSSSLNNLRGLFEVFIDRYLERAGLVVQTGLEALNISMQDVLNKMLEDPKLMFSDALEKYMFKAGCNISRSEIDKLSTTLYKFINLKFAGSNEESFDKILRRITLSRVITDTGKLPFDIPLGLVPGKLDLGLPYNSYSFGEVNFARLVVAYINEYIIEQFDLRNDGVDGKSIHGFPRFVDENCVANAIGVIKKGGVDLQHALDQSCSSELPWLNSKILRMLISGFMTYCKLNLRGFPHDKSSRDILDYSREHLNSPLVVFDQQFKTWTMKNMRSIQLDEDESIGKSIKFSTLESVGVVDKATGIINFSTSSFCSELSTFQVNRLIVKLQYYRYCISEGSIMNLDIDRLLDLNVWCLALRQEMPGMKKTYSNMLFTYFGIRGTIKQSFEIMEDSFESVEALWLGETTIVSVKQWIHDFYSSHSEPLVKLNSLIKSGRLFCPTIVTEEELYKLQNIQKNELFNRVEAFQGFSEIYLRDRYGIVFESKPIIVALLINSFSKIKPSISNIKLIKSMIPIVNEEVSGSLIDAFNDFEDNLLNGGQSSIENLYQNPLCESVQGNWNFYVDLKVVNMVNLSVNSKFIFTELEINRIQTIVAFFNVALSSKYPEKLSGSYISFKHIATLLKSGIDLSSKEQYSYYFHGILQDDLSFSPWLTIKVLKEIFHAFITWEGSEILKVSPTKISGLLVSNMDMTKYSSSPVGMIHGKWHWYTWCKRPNFEKLVREAVLGDEVIHTISPQERNLFGIPSIKHKYEIATLFIQYFLQEVLSILVPFKPVVTMEILTGKTNLPTESVEFLKNLWEHYKNSFIYKGVLPKHDIFHNPIINVVNKQRFFPNAGFPQFDFFDTTSIPSSLIEVKNLYGGASVGSKFGIQRLVSICIFINASFEIFVRDLSGDFDILTPMGLYPIFKDRMNVLFKEVADDIVKLLRTDYSFYLNTEEKALHVNNTLLGFGRFEDE
ncbi:hypothetical protein OJ253_3686, partial [Cryptosporidium canis]